jgi:hypothetical protein
LIGGGLDVATAVFGATILLFLSEHSIDRPDDSGQVADQAKVKCNLVMALVLID